MLGSIEVEGTGRKAGPHIQPNNSGPLATGTHMLRSSVDNLALLCGAPTLFLLGQKTHIPCKGMMQQGKTWQKGLVERASLLKLIPGVWALHSWCRWE
jgi:hypothetical protein